MMNYPLSLRNILYRAKTIFPKKEVVCRDFSGMLRYTYGEMYRRVCRLANVLKRLGIRPGDRVGSFAWNTHRHLELYFAVPCSGAVLNTVNIRLFRDHLVHCINFAENRVLFVDEDLVPVIEDIAPELKTVEAYVIMTDKAVLPETSLAPVFLYEELLAGERAEYDFPFLDEWTPAIMAYTTATTGFPKGVVYTHRGLYLLSLALTSGEYGVFERDVSMPVVPMFHVNAWCRPFSEALVGAKLVLPGCRPQPADLCALIHQERVSIAFAVPTVWMGILDHARRHPGRYDFSCVRYFKSGGAATPAGLIADYEKILGVLLLSGYGQTETSPTTVDCYPKSNLLDLPEPDKYILRAKTGLLLPGLEMRAVKENGEEVRHDGKEMGELMLKGPWVISEYYKDPEKTAAAF
ncbi:MAG: AMP-binding protein, partial [Desulfotomaculales bacterium]